MEENAEKLRMHLVAIQEQVMMTANKTKKPRERARHQEACKHAVLVFFKYLSRGVASERPCTYDECAAVADKGDNSLYFSTPVLYNTNTFHCNNFMYVILVMMAHLYQQITKRLSVQLPALAISGIPLFSFLFPSVFSDAYLIVICRVMLEETHIVEVGRVLKLSGQLLHSRVVSKRS